MKGLGEKSVKGGATNIVVMKEAMLAKRYVVGGQMEGPLVFYALAE